MRPLLVAAIQPVGGYADFPERFKDAAVQDLLAVGMIEAFDITVLHGLSGLDEQPFDVVVPAPLFEHVTDQFGIVVHAQAARPTA